MFLFYKKKDLVKGDNTKCPYCGSLNGRVTTRFNYLSFTVLPLFPLSTTPCYTCISCGRETSVDSDVSLSFPKVSKFRWLSKFIGFPLIFAATWIYQSHQTYLLQLEQTYRAEPFTHDVLFVDNSLISPETYDVTYPYRIAKIANIDIQNNTTTVNLSNVSYNNVTRAIRDYSSKGHLYNSFFLRQTIELPLKTLQDHQAVLAVKRPFNPLDLEKLQESILFEKNFAENPYYK